MKAVGALLHHLLPAPHLPPPCLGVPRQQRALPCSFRLGRYEKLHKMSVPAVSSKREHLLHMFIFLLLPNGSVTSGQPGKLPCTIKLLFLKIRLDSMGVHSPIAGGREETASSGKIKTMGNQGDPSLQSIASLGTTAVRPGSLSGQRTQKCHRETGFHSPVGRAGHAP